MISDGISGHRTKDHHGGRHDVIHPVQERSQELRNREPILWLLAARSECPG